MKVCVIQPPYSTDFTKIDEYFKKELSLLAECDSSMDIIVLPEASDLPCLAPSREEMNEAIARFHAPLMEAAAETARRCNAILFVSGYSEEEDGLRNATFALNRRGEVVGKYFKQHLTPGEVTKTRLDSGYTFTHTEPTVIEIEGLRFGFLTCYDFYFYEAFPTIARAGVDFIIGCSHQRSDTHRALEIMTQFLAYNTNAYVLRASVSMDEGSDVGGASMIVAPTGEILAHMYSRVGLATVELDPKNKYYKPAGFGNPPAAHYEYVEKGRRPWKYRPAGSAIATFDAFMPYPRTCAHRGVAAAGPENSLASLGAAVAMGAQEIEFDVWPTKDGEAVVLHDQTLERVSNGVGLVYEKTYEELLSLDFGSYYSEGFAGLSVLRLEELLKKLGCHAVMNIHVKTPNNQDAASEDFLKKILALIDKYDCRRHVYFMSGNDTVQAQLARLAPDIPRCCGGGDAPWEIVSRAIALGCKRVQLYAPYFNREMIEKAHENGIICNVFYTDSPEEAETLLDMGIDVILTNNFCAVSPTVQKREKYVAF